MSAKIQETKAIQNTIKEKVKQLRKTLVMEHKLTGKIVEELQDISDEIAFAEARDNDASDELFRRLTNTADDTVRIIADLIFRLHYMSTTELIKDFQLDKANFDRTKYSHVDKAIYETEAVFKGDVLYVKLPLLQNRNGYRSLSGEIQYARIFTTSCFADGVEFAVKEAIQNTDIDVKKWQKKQLQYFFISNSKEQISDADNYDTTSITNAVTAPFGGDAANTISIHMEADYSPDFPIAGTIIALTPAHHRLLTLDEIMNFWTQHIAENKPIFFPEKGVRKQA